MVLIDTSMWINYLRRTKDVGAGAVRQALKDETAATTDLVYLEVMSGTTDPARAAKWDRLLGVCTFLPQLPIVDAREAARIYRDCRRAGETPRTPTDCLIAAVAIRAGATVLHRDRDFDVIARHSRLQVASG